MNEAIENVPHSDGRVRRARKLRKARRAELLQAAKDVFGALGYHGASLNHLLEAAGVARATFYKHFDGKDAAFAAVLQTFLQRLAGAIEPVVVDGDRSVTDQLVGNFARILGLLEDEPGLTRLLLQHPPGVTEAADAHMGTFFAGARHMIQRSITSGIALGLVQPGDVELRATFVLGAVKEAVAFTLLGDAGARDRRELAEALLTFALHGILAK